MGAAMYADAEADAGRRRGAGADGAEPATADDDVVDAEIVDEDATDGERASDRARATRTAGPRASGTAGRTDAGRPRGPGARRRRGRRTWRPRPAAPAATASGESPADGRPDRRRGRLAARRRAGRRAAPPTCSGCRPSTSTTSAGSTATASWSARTPRSRVLAELLPVLDDIDRAREHGELEGGFKAVAESLERDRRRSSAWSSSATAGDAVRPDASTRR